MTPVGAPPTTELGTFSNAGVLPWNTFIDFSETHVPELVWPNSVRAYDVMRTDSQIAGLLAGATLPIRRYHWMLEPNGAQDKIVQGIADDMGLDIKGEEPKPRGRTRNRFNHDDHLRQALLALAFGHTYFEQVGEVGDDGLWHLRKLAPRLPNTIMQIEVAPDGGLIGIKQMVAQAGKPAPLIPVDRLVAYVWEKEGGQWVGRSMLRSLYRSWLIKDRLVRVDAMKHERNGLGMPVAKAAPGAGASEVKALDKMMQEWKAGERSGGAIPSGTDVSLVGTIGSLPDTVGSIRYHDEAMARALLMMFMQLGQTETGSRALGQSFIDYFQLAQEALANWYAGITTAHVIEDWVDWNYGPDEQAPILTYVKDEEPDIAFHDLAELIRYGGLTMDAELEDAIRTAAGYPKRGKDTPPPGPPTTLRETAAPGDAPAPVAAAAPVDPTLPLPARKLRRQPYPHEVRAAVDFQALDSIQTSTLATLVGEVKQHRAQMVDELHDQIVQAAGNLDKLTALTVEGAAADAIASHMIRQASTGATLAVQEAQRQGKTIQAPVLSKVHGRLQARAKATDKLLARSLADTASRKAVSLTGGSILPGDVADAVKAHLTGLSDSYLEDQLNGALMQALNEGRREVMEDGNATEIYASELLDGNTCESCTAIDGTSYQTMDDAQQDYPTGGYGDCDGGPRCRGTLVAVYDETASDLADAA